MPKIILFTAFLFVANFGFSQTQVFEGARLIVGNGTVIEDSTLVVQSGVIQSEAVIPAGAEYISLEGKTIMPLLIDIHGHIGFLKDGVFSAKNYTRENIIEQLQILEYFGVGAFLSLGTEIGPDPFRIREEQKLGRIGGAKLFIAGRGFVAPGGGPAIEPLPHVPYEVDRPEFARLLVRELVDRDVDIIKIWVDDRNGTVPKLSPEVYRAIIDEAHMHHKRVMAHVYYLEDAKDLLRAGVDGFAHMVRDIEVDDEFVRLAQKHDIIQVANLSIQSLPVGSGWMNDPGFREATPASATRRYESESGMMQDLLARSGKFRELMRKSVPKIKAAGIRIALGADTGIPGRFVGYTAHLELRALVDAGLTPLEAITAGTSVNAAFLGLDELGTLEVGKRADFIILDANPLEDIENSTRIAEIYRMGIPLDRESIRARWMH